MTWLAVLLVIVPIAASAQDGAEVFGQRRDTGYRGIWYSNQPSGDAHRFKYSGGLATYPQQHVPIAVHAPNVGKTFFVYGGADAETGSLLHMVSYFDHATGTVPRPVILLDKQTRDAHDNPTLTLDEQGYLWVLSNAHGTSRPSYVHKSLAPYSIEGFRRVAETNFSYAQPWWVEGRGLRVFFTRYEKGRRHLYFHASEDGRDWGDPKPLARFGVGHYQVSWQRGGKLATAFNYHPQEGGLNARTNLYYLESSDGGERWVTAAGRPVALPLAEPINPALVVEAESEERLVYLKAARLDEDLRPVLLFLTSESYRAGPESGPRQWQVSQYLDGRWISHSVTTSDHNYDFGAFSLDGDGTWRLVAPTAPGPQPHGTGGEMVFLESRDRGATWSARPLTAASARNHTYARHPVRAHPDFHALWADGDAHQKSPSHLYLTDRAGSGVWRLPEDLGDSATSAPERVFQDLR